MKDDSLKILQERRDALVLKLAQLGSKVIRGSLIERYKRCGKSTCKCVQGKGHGPKYYLSISRSGKRPEMKYIPQRQKDLIQEYIQNLQTVRDILESISEINQELIRLQTL